MRDFTVDDQPRVRALVLEGLRERWGEAFDPAHNPDLDDIAATYIARGGDVVVFESKGMIVAVGP